MKDCWAVFVVVVVVDVFCFEKSDFVMMLIFDVVEVDTNRSIYAWHKRWCHARMFSKGGYYPQHKIQNAKRLSSDMSSCHLISSHAFLCHTHSHILVCLDLYAYGNDFHQMLQQKSIYEIILCWIHVSHHALSTQTEHYLLWREFESA